MEYHVQVWSRKEYDYFLIVNLSLYSSPEHNAQVCFSYHLASGICRPLSFHILIFFSKTAKSNWTKLGHDTPYMFFFQNSVRWPCPTSKMAAMESDWLKNWKSLKIFLGCRTRSPDGILEKKHVWSIMSKFGPIWLSSFWEEDQNMKR
jgi:hypothetical protein